MCWQVPQTSSILEYMYLTLKKFVVTLYFVLTSGF
jgi:hypothetical protein